jgi:hypothetical protein
MGTIYSVALQYGPVAGLEHFSDLTGLIKCREFLEQLSDYKLVKGCPVELFCS